MPRFSSLRNRLARVPTRKVVKHVLLAAMGLLVLEIIYVIVANLILASSLVRDGVGTGDGVRLEYASARTWLPGRVHLREFDLRVEDYNVQVELKIGRASLDVQLLALFSKRFRATRLVAGDLRLRMRHKVHAVGKNGPRLEAYAPIDGFADPPLYRGPPPAPTPNPESLWSVQVDDVVAHTRELWILEYRFEGDAEARGAFLLRPALLVRVDPASLHFDSGTLRVGRSTVANVVRGRITFSMPHLDVPATHGNAAFGQMSSQVDLTLRGGELQFLDVYTEPRASVRLQGPALWNVAWRVEHGIVAPHSRVELHAPRFVLETAQLALRGGARTSVTRNPASRSFAIDAALNDVTLQANDSCTKPPRLTQLTSSLELEGVDLTQSITPGKLTLSGSALAPELACLNPLIPGGAIQLGGSAEVSAQLSRAASGRGDGSATLDVKQGQMRHADHQFQGELHAEAEFRLARNDENSNYAKGAVSLHLTQAQSLLSFALGQPFRDIVSGALGLDDLQANVAFHAERDQLVLELTSSRSGAVTGKGHWRLPLREKPKGAVLLSSGPVHVGITLNGSAMDVAPLVSDDWLSSRSADSQQRQ